MAASGLLAASFVPENASHTLGGADGDSTSGGNTFGSVGTTWLTVSHAGVGIPRQSLPKPAVPLASIRNCICPRMPWENRV